MHSRSIAGWFIILINYIVSGAFTLELLKSRSRLQLSQNQNDNESLGNSNDSIKADKENTIFNTIG